MDLQNPCYRAIHRLERNSYREMNEGTCWAGKRGISFLAPKLYQKATEIDLFNFNKKGNFCVTSLSNFLCSLESSLGCPKGLKPSSNLSNVIIFYRPSIGINWENRYGKPDYLVFINTILLNLL